MLEATMSYRCRWFEYLNYRPLMQQLFQRGPEVPPRSAPKPRLTDADYHPDYLSEKIGDAQRLEWAEKSSLSPPKKSRCLMRPMCCVLAVIWWCNTGLPPTSKGIEWLRRHFPDHRVHTVNFPGDPYPIHIDATFTPLRPGLILNNPQRRLPEDSARCLTTTVGRLWMRRSLRTTRRRRCAIRRHGCHECAGA